HLPAAFGAEKAEMRHDDAQPRAANVEVDVERVARLASPIAEREAPHFQHFAAGEKRVAARAVVAHERDAGNRLHAQAPGDIVEPVIDFLPADRGASALAMASPNMVVASVPGRRPIAVPAITCQSRMWIAPATMLSTANGAIGTSLSSVIASSPYFFSTSIMRSSFGPARRRTVSRFMRRPM